MTLLSGARVDGERRSESRAALIRSRTVAVTSPRTRGTRLATKGRLRPRSSPPADRRRATLDVRGSSVRPKRLCAADGVSFPFSPSLACPPLSLYLSRIPSRISNLGDRSRLYDDCCGVISDDRTFPTETFRRAVNPSRGPFTSRGTVYAKNQTSAYRNCSNWSLIPSPSSRLTIPASKTPSS